MTPLNTAASNARTGAISATAVLSATGLFAAPAAAHTPPADAPQAAPMGTSMATSMSIGHHAIERALAPAAAPVVISTALPVATAPAAVAAAKHATHTIVRGDTVWDLARHYGSTVTAIIDANGLDARATIHVGDRLVIPGATQATSGAKKASASTTTTKSAKAKKATKTHTVASGDTVWDIAATYGSTVNAIVDANGLGRNAVIHVGDRLSIPGAKADSSNSGAKPAKTTKSTKATTTSTASGRYTVKSGDTLSKIAQRFGSSVKAIAAANGISNPSKIRVGQSLTIPGGVPTGLVGDTFLGRTYPKDVVSAANVNKHALNNTDVPSRAQMRSLIAKTARKHGVDVSLALAISYQESGFNQRAVSPANAVGVMQVIPSTAEWMSTVVGRELDMRDPEDNVTAGVVLLKYLTRNASSLDQAIAGYYQGLAGVRKNGMNSDTKQYVKSVRSLMKQFD